MTAADCFEPYARTSRHLDLTGPVFQHRDDRSVVGLPTDEHHTHSHRIVHHGLLLAAADTVIGHAERAARGARGITASLPTYSTAASPDRRWLLGVPGGQRAGRRLASTTCAVDWVGQLVRSDTALLATTEAKPS